MDCRRGMGGSVCLEASFPDYLDPDCMVVSEEELELPAKKRRKTSQGRAGVLGKARVTGEEEDCKRVERAIRLARLPLEGLEFEVRPAADYRGHKGFYILNGPCVYKGGPHLSNNMFGYLGVSQLGEPTFFLRCHDCRGKRPEQIPVPFR